MRGGLGRTAVADIRNLSMLFSVDAFGGGGLVTQSLLSYWFYIRYGGVTLRELGLVFMVVNVVTAISLVIAPLIAERIGNLRTMVYTHIISNIFLILIPLAGSFTGGISHSSCSGRVFPRWMCQRGRHSWRRYLVMRRGFRRMR